MNSKSFLLHLSKKLLLMEHHQLFRFVYLLGAVNAIFFSILLFKKAHRTAADKILGIWLIVLFFQLIIPFIYLIENNTYFNIAGYEIVFLGFHPILLYDYIITLTGRKRKIKKRFVLYLPAIFSALIAIWALSIPLEIKINIYHGDLKLPIKIWVAFLCSFSCFEIFLFLSFRELRKHRKKILSIYSFRDNVDLYWLWKLVFSFSIIYTIVMTFFMCMFFMGKSLFLADFIMYGFMAVFIFFIGYWGWQQGNIFYSTGINEIELIPEITNEVKIKKHSKIELSDEGIKLKQFVETQKLYLNQNLSLHDLANETLIQPHQLSKLIHREFGINFFEFINRYRVEYFKNTVNSTQFKNYTLLAIAFECGFNSKASFNRIFKEYTGITPAEFRLKKKSQLIDT